MRGLGQFPISVFGEPETLLARMIAGGNTMQHVTANTARKDLDELIDNVTRYNEPVTIVSDNDKVAILLSIE